MEKPKSIVVETFFNTAEEVETAVNAIYSPLRSNIAVYEATLECHTDYAYGRGSWAPIHEFQGLNDANINRVSGLWNAFYLSIRNANLVIANAANAASISEEDKNRLIAEAKFLRAYAYFQLVRNWGGVPIRTEENMTVPDLAKSSAEDVYNLIVNDLTVAETNLPSNPSVAGRPTTWAAKTMLADVYLQLERFQESGDKALQVIESGNFSLVKVSSASDFQSKVFGPDLLSTTEEIFYFKFAREIGQGNYMLWITNHPSTNLFNFGGAYAVYGDAANPFYTSWNDDDYRKGLWDLVNIGLGSTSLVSSKFIDNQAVGQNGAGNDDQVYGLSDALLIYAEAATRATNTSTSEAVEALNKVHRRAYGYDPETPSPVDYAAGDYTDEELLSLILRESGYEFQYGGKRWLNLKRTGKAKDIILAAKGKVIADKHLLWPIPVSEMNYNKALNPSTDQNPGY